ncbi:MAG TPA: glycosyltransferase [Terracidiphilus sp.]
MIWLVVSCALGLPAGVILLWRLPLCGDEWCNELSGFSIVVPARNEERNLPHLMSSIREEDLQPLEIIIIDDASDDRTAIVAKAWGATVITARPLQQGWTGKTWACHQGAGEVGSDVLMFLDADTYFEPGGLRKVIASYRAAAAVPVAFSVIPYHVMRKPYEELSLFFNLLMAMGAGGFGLIGKPRLFGQSLVIARDIYERSGGHSGVRRSILENLAFSSNVESAGGVCACRGGRGALNVRMFPDGIGQLCEGWAKAFADGAAASEPMVLVIATFWLAALCSTVFALIFVKGTWHLAFAGLYAGYVLQLFWLSRQLGNYRILTSLLYPLPLFFYFGVFGQSLFRRVFKRNVSWRGRQI